MRHSSIFILLIIIIFLFSLSCGIFDSNDNPVINKDGPVTVTTVRPYWKLASSPLQIDNTYQRGKILWHHPYEKVPVEEIYNSDANPGENAVSMFRMIFRPDTSGNPSWAGITTGFDTPILDSTEYFEFRAKGSHGIVHFDFGLISEDINGDGIPQTEDYDQDGYVNIEEDIGMDGVPDPLEAGYSPSNLDPNGDDWFSFANQTGICPIVGGCQGIGPDDSLFYEFLNGTEGNGKDPATADKPDKENFYNSFNVSNSYMSCVIDLSNSPLRIDSTEKNGWYTYRIPLRDTVYIKTYIDNFNFLPDWINIKHVRVWFEENGPQTSPDTFEVADWHFDQLLSESYEPSNAPDTTYIRDYEYRDRLVFDLGLPGEMARNDVVTKLIIYESVFPADNPDGYPIAGFYVDPTDTSQYQTENIQTDYNIHVEEINPDAYVYFNDTVKGLHYIIFNSQQISTKHIGCYMEVLKENGSTVTYGSILDSVYILKLLYRSNSQPDFVTWDLMWRNCYQIPKGVTLDDLDIDIYKGIPGTEEDTANLDYQINGDIETPYIEVLGLDQYNKQGLHQPDGIIDDRYEIFKPDMGLLIFLHRTPFDTDTVYNSLTPLLTDRVPQLYNYTSMTERVSNSLYYFRLILYHHQR